MLFFKRKETDNQSKTADVKDLYVVTTTITSDYNDGKGLGPRCVTWYFLAKQVNGEYFELFANKKLEKEENTHKGNSIYQKFNTPYVKKAEPITYFMKKKNLKELETDLLFDFITNMNVLNSMGALE